MTGNNLYPTIDSMGIDDVIKYFREKRGIKLVKLNIPEKDFAREIYKKTWEFNEPCNVSRIAVTLHGNGTLHLFLIDKNGNVQIDSEQILKLDME